MSLDGAAAAAAVVIVDEGRDTELEAVVDNTCVDFAVSEAGGDDRTSRVPCVLLILTGPAGVNDSAALTAGAAAGCRADDAEEEAVRCCCTSTGLRAPDPAPATGPLTPTDRDAPVGCWLRGVLVDALGTAGEDGLTAVILLIRCC